MLRSVASYLTFISGKIDRSKRDVDGDDDITLGFGRKNSKNSFRVAKRTERTPRVAKKEAPAMNVDDVKLEKQKSEKNKNFNRSKRNSA